VTFHVGLRKEASDWLDGKIAGPHPSEAYVRDMRAKALDTGDEVAHGLWSRLLWRLYVKERYGRRVEQRLAGVPTVLKLVDGGG
jgi:hypothetical protein